MLKQRVIALGFFDGVHLGHFALMKRAREIGEKKALIPSVTTFDIHPQFILHSKEVELINSPEDRAWLIHSVCVIDDTLILHFDKKTTQITWDDFIIHLVEEFGARYLVAGEDYKFGNNGEGNSILLAQKCAQMGLGCDIVAKVKYDRVPISSTLIRELLKAGDIKHANELLGHPHILSDIVRYGFHLGSKLGTPTINMLFGEGVLVPAHGVYATRVYIENKEPYTGVTNVGARPTVGNSGKITAETHLLNFRGNLYGRRVRIEFHDYIRPEKKFTGLDELKAQIQKDCALAEQYFS